MELEQRIIAALRLQEPAKVDEGRGWQVWRYRLRDPASQMQMGQELFLLFLRSRGVNKSDLPDLARRLREHVRGGKVSVAVQRSSPLAGDLNLLKTELRVQSVKLLSELLQEESRHLLGDFHPNPDANPYFVEPVVDTSPALSKLRGWLLSGDHLTPEPEPSVGVLLAPAGVGKTSVARELARSLQGRNEHDVLPLLIESAQWSSLNPFDPPSLWSLIKHAWEFGGHNAVSRDTFELFARAGYIVTIFDGLDEVGSIRGGALTPVEVIEQLRKLAEESDCRVLLTSRDGLWTEMVPPEFRKQVREFRLQPFRREQIARYREKRFPNPRRPERERFDEILQAVTKAAHPKGTAEVDFEERAPAAPLILHLAATEAEEQSDATSYGLIDLRYREPLYAITYGILNREHLLRGLCLTPAQQFMMISTLVVDMGLGPYSFAEVQTAAEYALGNSLPDGQLTALKSHPLLKSTDPGSFAFRFEYLIQFAPAVWLCDYVVGGIRSATVEKYLGSIAGRSSPVSGYVAELLRPLDWKPHLIAHMQRLKNADAEQRAAIPFLWEVAQSLLPGPGDGSRSSRLEQMSEVFGTREGNKVIFAGLLFSGPIAYIDFRGVSFRGCTFSNCEWINCDLNGETEFKDCTFKGRFLAVQSPGLRTAIYSPLNDQNADADARKEFEKLLDRATGLTTNLEAVVGMLIGLMQQFRGPGFFVPRTRDQLTVKYLGPTPVRDVS